MVPLFPYARGLLSTVSGCGVFSSTRCAASRPRSCSRSTAPSIPGTEKRSSLSTEPSNRDAVSAASDWVRHARRFRRRLRMPPDVDEVAPGDTPLAPAETTALEVPALALPSASKPPGGTETPATPLCPASGPRATLAEPLVAAMGDVRILVATAAAAVDDSVPLSRTSAPPSVVTSRPLFPPQLLLTPPVTSAMASRESVSSTHSSAHSPHAPPLDGEALRSSHSSSSASPSSPSLTSARATSSSYRPSPAST
mmetsp:Transcript_31280/g.78361  ORF Transcript_31280/g.78361 Transcript_31280/m.78361 type:complete len:254 (-) Transcript_31280:2381-3142(-)